ncbi:hypothetical protein IIA79_02915 [bacterium]|nr:hypothetical protein [bacterium]
MTMICVCASIAMAQEHPTGGFASQGGAAAAQSGGDPAAADNYGYKDNEVAENQGVVAYWYAHGYRNAFGSFPATWADVVSAGLPLRKFVSPHNGDEIDFDDGSLDFDGDMMYKAGSWDVEVHVKTSSGVTVIPGVLSGRTGPFYGCQTGWGCYACCDVTVYKCEYWHCLGPQDAVCKIVQWIMWRSFETYECLYGTRPCDDTVWIASGLAPIDANWKEYAPFMDIEYVWRKCTLRKAYVNCCSVCVRGASPCGRCAGVSGYAGCTAKSRCGKCGRCAKGISACAKCGSSPCSCSGAKAKCGKCGVSPCSCGAKAKCGQCGFNPCRCGKAKCGRVGCGACR